MLWKKTEETSPDKCMKMKMSCMRGVLLEEGECETGTEVRTPYYSSPWKQCTGA